ncbi:hypothetical protein LSH36_144g05023 [Paralvinella palmiformis]|uniref:Uncharacterized protein n=1 Tax=Paralvinella palmiformis TaxID=53620 RepID=A0AAD9JVE5_9ANNE|nr:hypothetical protein LSH36_144g05023 [Paralvinella palmiformis]
MVNTVNLKFVKKRWQAPSLNVATKTWLNLELKSCCYSILHVGLSILNLCNHNFFLSHLDFAIHTLHNVPFGLICTFMYSDIATQPGYVVRDQKMIYLLSQMM